METVLTSLTTPTINNTNNIPVDLSVRSSSHGSSIPRRSAPFRPPIWHSNHVQSITTQYHQGEPYASHLLELKENVRLMLNNDEIDHLTKLEHVDMIQRLGLSYHFENEIERIIEGLYNDKDTYKQTWKDNLYATTLHFRLLRQHQYVVSQEVFINFMDEVVGSFKPHIANDVNGMLGLYEASFYMLPNEVIMDEAREFTTKHLEEYVKSNNDKECYVSTLVEHALDVPLHWRVSRLEARWFIDQYRIKPDFNPIFLELAILDYNIVQSMHQQELKESFSLWTKLGVAEKLKFGRDRLVENSLWVMGLTFEPQNGYYRKYASIYHSLITLIDDIYDTYGTLDELQLFTNAFESWDLNAMDPLPDYMKLCFLAIYNHTNQLAYDVLKEQGIQIIKYLKFWLADLFKAYFQEAKWYYAKKTPTLKEYLENGWHSMAMPAVVGFAYCCVANPITEEALEALEHCSSIIRQSSLVCRFINDLATSSFELEKGDAQKSVQCYMHDTGVSEEEASEHVRFLARKSWEVINKDRCDQNSPFSRTFHELIINTARICIWIYHKRDGFGYQSNIETKEWAELVYAKPIPLDPQD